MIWPYGYGVKFGEYHSFKDLGMVLSSKSIGMPSPRLETVTVIGRNGDLDLTEALSGEVSYGNRELDFEFGVIGGANNWVEVMSNVTNKIHGKLLNIILDDDTSYFYKGRCTIDTFNTDKNLAKIVIKCDCEPYRIEETSAVGDAWKWDPFSFENGLIYKSSYTVAGQIEINLINRNKLVSPTFVTDSDMTVTYDGTTYSLPKGTTPVYDIRLQYGDNKMTVKGTGAFTVTYYGGSF